MHKKGQLFAQLAMILSVVAMLVGFVPVNTEAGAPCYTVAELDETFGIVRDVPGTNDGLLMEGTRIHGAVLRVTGVQEVGLKANGWTLQGSNPEVKSAWAPTRCRPLEMGTPTQAAPQATATVFRIPRAAAQATVAPSSVVISGIKVPLDTSRPRWTRRTSGDQPETIGFALLEGEVAYVFGESINASVGGPVYRIFTDPGHNAVTILHGSIMVFSTQLALSPETFTGFRYMDESGFSQADGRHLLQEDTSVQGAFLEKCRGDAVCAELEWVKAHNAQVEAVRQQPASASTTFSAQQAQLPACPTDPQDVAKALLDWETRFGKGAKPTQADDDELGRVRLSLKQMPKPDNNGWQFFAYPDQARQLMAHDTRVIVSNGVTYNKPGQWTSATNSATVWLTGCSKG